MIFKSLLVLWWWIFPFSFPFSWSLYSSDVLQWLDEEEISWNHANGIPRSFDYASSTFVELKDSSILLHLISTPTNQCETLPPNLNKRLTDWISSASQKPYSKIVHLHQDVWLAKTEIVKSRLLVQAGAKRSGNRIFARKTVATRVNATAAIDFLERHHLWGGTRAKYYYGLFRNEKHGADGELVAVATFSSRRKVKRNGKVFKSHELLRYCAQRDATVVGGISKLCKEFINDVKPDDIVTVVDRDWGDGSGWHSLGFDTVSVMDPLVMVVNPKEPGIRRHLVGAGISHESNNGNGRMGLPMEVLVKLDSINDSKEALQLLASENYYTVFDTGVERLLRVVSGRTDTSSTKRLWQFSEPKYASNYYSQNLGIVSLLNYASSQIPLDSPECIAMMESWRATSGTAASAKLIFSTPSSMDSNATIEVRERGFGWRTVGLVGSKKNPSIYHGMYKVNEQGVVDPTAVVPEFIKTMAALSLIGLEESGEEERALRFLHLGYGAGTLVRLLAHHVANSHHVAVELDSGVVHASNALISNATSIELYVEDALTYAEKDQEPFDCICIDVFDENMKVPEAFYSENFLKQLSSNLLTPTGIMVQNFHSGGKQQTLILENVADATSCIFTDSCWVEALDSKPNAGNVVNLASNAWLKEENDHDIIQSLSRKALVIQSKYHLTFDALARVQRAKPMPFSVVQV